MSRLHRHQNRDPLFHSLWNTGLVFLAHRSKKCPFRWCRPILPHYSSWTPCDFLEIEVNGFHYEHIDPEDNVLLIPHYDEFLAFRFVEPEDMQSFKEELFSSTLHPRVLTCPYFYPKSVASRTDIQAYRETLQLPCRRMKAFIHQLAVCEAIPSSNGFTSNTFLCLQCSPFFYVELEDVKCLSSTRVDGSEDPDAILNFLKSQNDFIARAKLIVLEEGVRYPDEKQSFRYKVYDFFVHDFLCGSLETDEAALLCMMNRGRISTVGLDSAKNIERQMRRLKSTWFTTCPFEYY